MSTLKLLVDSIIADLIDARFDADIRAAELAEHYQGHEILRALSVPALNIENVSIDLRFAFDDTPIEAATGPSEEQVKVVADVSKTVRDELMKLPRVTERVTVDRQRTSLSRALLTTVKNTMLKHVDAKAADRSAAVSAEITKTLAKSGVRNLPASEQKILRDQIARLEASFIAAPKAPPKSLPGVVVGTEALSKVDPATVSTLSFQVDLTERRWTDIGDGDGKDGTKAVLSDT